MSGFPAKLVARAHGTLLNVAPRPISRFENDVTAGGLVFDEEVLEPVTPRRSPAPTHAVAPTAAVPAAVPPTAVGPGPAEQEARRSPPAEPAHQSAPAAATPSVPPAPTLRQVGHHQLRIEREIYRETTRASDPAAGERPQAPLAEPVATPLAPPVPRTQLVEIIERITGQAPAAEEAPARMPAPQPAGMVLQTATSATPARRDVAAPAARRTATTRAPEPTTPAPVHVHIDRIEVRTATTAKPRAVPRTRQQAADTAPSLQAFLAGKGGR